MRISDNVAGITTQAAKADHLHNTMISGVYVGADDTLRVDGGNLSKANLKARIWDKKDLLDVKAEIIDATCDGSLSGGTGKALLLILDLLEQQT